jgi:hypothetical protein
VGLPKDKELNQQKNLEKWPDRRWDRSPFKPYNNYRCFTITRWIQHDLAIKIKKIGIYPTNTGFGGGWNWKWGIPPRLPWLIGRMMIKKQ